MSVTSRRHQSQFAVALVALISAAFLNLDCTVAVRAASTGANAGGGGGGPEYDEEDYWWDTEEYTELWNFVEARRWSKAIERVKSHPDEASVLVLRRERTGRVHEKSLPLHKAFAVDVVEDARPLDAPPPDRSDVPPMPTKQIELVEALLTKHPDAAKVVDAEGRLPLHLAAYSSVSPPSSVVTGLIGAYPGATTRTDGSGRLPLHAACSAPLSSSDLVRAVAMADPDAVRRADGDGALPLHLTAWAGGRRLGDAARAVEHLHGAYPESVRVPDGDGDTALMIMVKYGRTSPDALDFLLRVDPGGPAARRGAAVEESAEEIPEEDESSSDTSTIDEGVDDSDGGETVLHGALAGPGHDSTADMLGRILAVHPDLAGRRDPGGKLPIHILLDHCCASLDAVKVLVEAYPDGVRVADAKGRLPLHHACRESVDDPDIVRYLLDADAGGAGTADGSGALPLHLAIEAPSGRADEDENGVPPMDRVVAALVDAHPVSAAAPDPRNEDSGPLLPLHAALRRHRSPVAIRSLVAAHPESARAPVVAANGDGSSENESGALALHVLAEERDEYRPLAAREILDVLLEAHPDGAGTADGDGRLPLHFACRPAKDVPPRRRRELEREAELAGRDTTAQEVLVKGLLAARPGAAAVKDGDGDLPLHHACRTHGEGIVMALLDAHPDGAAVVSEGTGLVPLQIACGALRTKYESYEGGKAVDAIVSRLVELHPEGAAEGSEGTKSDGGGSSKGAGLPLHLVSASAALSPHLGNETVLALIAANPAAVRTRDAEGNLPLHNAIANRPHDTGKSTVLIRSLLWEFPGAASEPDSRGSLPLHIALTHARGGTATGSTYRRICKLLFDAHPAAALAADAAGRLPAHRVAKIVGETGGVGRDMPGWAALLRDVLERNTDALSETDDRGRTPLHCLCFAMADAVADLAEEGKAAKTSSTTMMDLLRVLLAGEPGALDVEDRGGNTPLDLVEHDRRLGHLGEDRGELSATFTAMKKEVTKGTRYWKTVGAVGQEQGQKQEAVETGTEEVLPQKAGSDEL